MRGNQKNKTSVFSEYQNNQNDSISSRQLQYWLKQTAPTVQPKFAGIQWTLMSTNSIFEQEQHTLQRNDTFQSLPNKENDYSAFNSAKPTLSNNSSGVMKSKSYVNAMVDLQNRVKHLQQENSCLKSSVTALKEQRNRVRNQSSHATEQLSQRIEMLQPKARKIDELVRDNKMLRDWRQQTTRKVKMLQKINKDLQAKLSEYEGRLQKNIIENNNKDELNKQLTKDLDNQKRERQTLKEILAKLQERNKVLEDMKEKSTSSIIEKYNKSVDMLQTLTSENMKLKQEHQILKDKYENRLKNIGDVNQQQKIELSNQVEVLRQELCEKKEKLSNIHQEFTYFKEKYEKVNEELIAALKNHAVEIKQIKDNHWKQLSKQRQKMEKQLRKERENVKKLLEDEKEKRMNLELSQKLKKNEIDIVDQSRIQPKQNPKILIESHLEFGETRSLEEEGIEERDFHETRSLEKNKGITSLLKSRKVKPLQTLSNQNQKEENIGSEKPKVNPKSQKSHKPKRLSQEKHLSHSREKSKSRSRSRQAQRQYYDQNKSFIVKSCQPVTQHQTAQHFLYSEEPYYYNSATNPRNAQYSYEPNDVAEFGLSQKYQGASKGNQLEQAMLIEINKETIRLIEEQQKCLSIINQDSTSSRRAENFGRMKQISQQIKVNNQKMIELKSKMASN